MQPALLVIATMVGTLIARQIIPRIGDTPALKKSTRLPPLAAPLLSFLALLVTYLMMGDGEQIFHAANRCSGKAVHIDRKRLSW
jgi:hypothetical protein